MGAGPNIQRKVGDAEDAVDSRYRENGPCLYQYEGHAEKDQVAQTDRHHAFTIRKGLDGSQPDSELEESQN